MTPVTPNACRQMEAMPWPASVCLFYPREGSLAVSYARLSAASCPQNTTNIPTLQWDAAFKTIKTMAHAPKSTQEKKKI